jgi:hypothetical protein
MEEIMDQPVLSPEDGELAPTQGRKRERDFSPPAPFRIPARTGFGVAAPEPAYHRQYGAGRGDGGGRGRGDGDPVDHSRYHFR